MIDPERALSLVLENTARTSLASVPVEAALGLTLAEQVRADRDYPPFNRAAMDGYAVRLADAGKTVQVIAVVPAGKSTEAEVVDGVTVEIMTGAPCPKGSQAVVMKEHVRRAGDRAWLPEVIRPGQHIAEKGSQCRFDTIILEEGALISPLATAVLASFGRQSVTVVRPPSVAILTTGDELVRPGVSPGEAQIRNSNGPMLKAQLAPFPMEQLNVLHVSDSLDALAAALDQVKSFSLIVISGGVSTSDRDFVPAALKTYGASPPILYEISQKPGKRMLFATRDEQLVFGLPGNPIASHFCLHRYVLAALRKKLGRDPRPLCGRGHLVGPLIEAASNRTYFVPARVRFENGRYEVEPLSNQGSADIFSIVSANAYVMFPPGERGRTGDLVAFELFPSVV
jgi:molybdopterin molybdotransferase